MSEHEPNEKYQAGERYTEVKKEYSRLALIASEPQSVVKPLVPVSFEACRGIKSGLYAAQPEHLNKTKDKKAQVGESS